MKSIVVIGGGAAGMMAALFSARNGARVTLIERNEKLGKKLYITGKGRCNLTNRAEPDVFMKQIPRNPRFLYAALAAFDSTDLCDLVEALGVPLKVERGDRVFPVSDKASDITRALERALRQEDVAIIREARVSALCLSEGKVCGVRLSDGREYTADAVIVATGGQSYPSTGSTGDGYALAESVGHTIAPTRPALSAIETVERWPEELSGLTLKNVQLSAVVTRKGKPVTFYADQGELLFTHFGLSGPLVLSLSSWMPDGECDTPVTMAIDTKPALDEATLDARLLRDLKAMSRKSIGTVMDGLVPHALGARMLTLARIPAGQPAHSITVEQRHAILNVLKHVPLTVRGLRPFEEAIITRGGVNVKEINPSTMASKRVEGLYFAGEVIDVDALTGGFNLQIAFSTGALAGQSAARA